MARKKELPKPLLALRHEFVAALENVCGEAIMLLQAVDMVVKNGNLAPPVADMLSERAKAMRAALLADA